MATEHYVQEHDHQELSVMFNVKVGYFENTPKDRSAFIKGSLDEGAVAALLLAVLDVVPEAVFDSALTRAKHICALNKTQTQQHIPRKQRLLH